MAIYNLGSINIDHVYHVPHLPLPGETLSAEGYTMGLGGKGANQSVAAARAGAVCFHIGALGPGSDWVLADMTGYGVDLRHVTRGDVPTGHAIIYVDPAAENNIVLFPGANRSLTAAMIDAALAEAGPQDTLMMQNETAMQAEAARIAAAKGMRVIYSAAPFDIAAVRAVLPHVSLLVMNEVEAAQLRAAEGQLPPMDVIITKGAEGAEWISAATEPLFVPAFKVTPVDTTGAGDTFIGTLAAGLDLGLDRAAAMRRASATSAVQVTRAGAAQAIPAASEVDDFLRAQSRAIPPA
ncbi:ribokinase [Gemmobacter fulvus]|uniref:Ribokinase n=1 Tax=Gemmobacter fulvus TaxID=2840474 RepID=A0A975P3L0_9RHOB|nr:ribokinase [Gemmobacter fulvus]MBT9246819.1 ribokinase [Gemmobacter fulvus]QWK89085.1 ribokinase [Gemmobacter fulvus]